MSVRFPIPVALAAAGFALCAAADAQSGTPDATFKLAYGGDVVHYPSTVAALDDGQCLSIYLRKQGDGWVSEVSRAPEKRAALLEDDGLERVFACVGGAPGMRGWVEKNGVVSVQILTGYYFNNCTNTESCEIPYKSAQFNYMNNWHYYSRMNRKKGYVAVNSAFLDKAAKSANAASWVDGAAVVRAASQAPLLDLYRQQYFTLMQAEAERAEPNKDALQRWLMAFGVVATDDAWRVVAPKLVTADAIGLAAQHTSAERFADLKTQARAYWQEKYRADWAPYRNVAVNADNVAAFDALGRRTPDTDAGTAFALVDFDNLAAGARDKVAKYVAAQNAQAAAAEQARVKAQADRLAAFEKKMAPWRKALKTGSATNCGPVLEAKGQLVKVYAPVKDYGNEHWLDRGTLYMPGERCFFLNGVYRPPYSAPAG